MEVEVMAVVEDHLAVVEEDKIIKQKYLCYLTNCIDIFLNKK
jgi:hypothetical protein